MKKLTALTIILSASITHAENYVPTDAYGNRKYDQTNYKTEGDKLIPTDSSAIVSSVKPTIKWMEIS